MPECKLSPWSRRLVTESISHLQCDMTCSVFPGEASNLPQNYFHEGYYSLLGTEATGHLSAPAKGSPGSPRSQSMTPVPRWLSPAWPAQCHHQKQEGRCQLPASVKRGACHRHSLGMSGTPPFWGVYHGKQPAYWCARLLSKPYAF